MEVRGTQEAASLSGGLAMNTSVRTVLWGTTALFGMVVAGAASAADIPLKAPPPAVPWSWAGFYIGAHGGYGWKDNDFAEALVAARPAPVPIGGINSQGGLVGGQGGYNWQFGPGGAGVEVGFCATQIKGGTRPGSVNIGVPDTEIRGNDVNYLGSARARLGYTYIPGILLYGTGGLAWERVDRIQQSRITIVNPPLDQTSIFKNPLDLFGWVAGAGIEARVSDTNWIARIPYLHYDFDRVEDQQVSISTNPALKTPFADRSGRQTIDVVRAALSYKFGVLAQAAEPPHLIGKAPVLGSWSWAGFYIGAHGGYGWKDNDFTRVLNVSPLITLGGINSKGGLGGGQAGYNWQYGQVVGGVEIDFSAADINGQSA